MSASRKGMGCASVFALLMVACAQPAETERTETEPSLAQESALVNPTDACPRTRFIGEWAGSSCPKPLPSTGAGSWQVARLFTSPTAPPGLRGFCAYDWQPGPTAAPVDTSLLPPGALPAIPGLSADCRVVAPLAANLARVPSVATELRSTTLKMADALAPLPTSARGPVDIRVAVVDSADDAIPGRPGVGVYAHGHAVGSLIRALSCPSNRKSAVTPCVGWLSNHLALTEGAPAGSSLPGGFFGRQTRLALAIVEAVDEWKASALASTQPRLVVNLSVGWDSQPIYGGAYAFGKYTQLPGPARAVNAAIRYASCQGALVIAAAGNASGGPSPSTGGTFPGAWESQPAPDATECNVFLGGPAVVPGNLPLQSTSGYRPLVYSVGGVDGRDQPLANTRPAGRPRLAAYGYHVTSQLPGETAAEVMSGTSMSTAMVSGLAATVWGYRPNLTASELMELIYGASVPLSAPNAALSADFCLGDNCLTQDIRRVSLCEVLASACARDPLKLTGAGRCPTKPITCPSTVAARQGVNPTWDVSTWDGAVATLPSLVLGMPSPCVGAACASAHATRYTQVATPWVGPQPSDTGCDVCRLEGSALYVSVDPSFPAWSGVSLSVETLNGSFVFPLSDALTAENRDSTFIVEGLPFDAQDILSATMSFANSDVQTLEPVLH